MAVPLAWRGRRPPTGIVPTPKTVKPVSFAAEAVEELAKAAAWCEACQGGLAVKFLEEIDQARQVVGSAHSPILAWLIPPPTC